MQTKLNNQRNYSTSTIKINGAIGAIMIIGHQPDQKGGYGHPNSTVWWYYVFITIWFNKK